MERAQGDNDDQAVCTNGIFCRRQSRDGKLLPSCGIQALIAVALRNTLVWSLVLLLLLLLLLLLFFLVCCCCCCCCCVFLFSFWLLLLVCYCSCSLGSQQQHAKCNLRTDLLRQINVSAAAQRYVLQIKLATSPSHMILTPGQQVQGQAP